MEKTVTRIGTRTNSFIRSWYIPEIKRAVNRILFYNENGIIASSNSSWLSSNPEYRDVGMYDIKSVEVKKKVNHHNANYNLEKAMANKCHFTLNSTKKSVYDDPACDLYLYVSGEDDKEADFILNNTTIHKELITFSYEFSAQVQTWKRAEIGLKCLAISSNTDRPKAVYTQNIENREDTKYENYLEELDKIYEEFRKKSVYVEKKDVARILNSFELIPRKETLLQQATKELKEKENIKEILEY